MLDEPTAGVDIELRQQLWANVRNLNEQGMTIILTTHYLEEAEEMCDRIAIVNEGRVVAEDTTANLLGRVTGKVLAVVPQEPTEPPPGLPDEVTCEKRSDGTLAFRYDARATTAGRVLDAIRDAGVTIRDVRTEEADLEEVFLSLTGHAA